MYFDTAKTVVTTTRATQGLSANQKSILKQRIERADLKGNCLIFFLLEALPLPLDEFLVYCILQGIQVKRLMMSVVVIVVAHCEAKYQTFVEENNGESVWEKTF